MKQNKDKIKDTAYNERFHASGGVCPLTVLWNFGSLYPAGSLVEAATSPSRHHVSSNVGESMWDNDEIKNKIIKTETVNFSVAQCLRKLYFCRELSIM